MADNRSRPQRGADAHSVRTRFHLARMDRARSCEQKEVGRVAPRRGVACGDAMQKIEPVTCSGPKMVRRGDVLWRRPACLTQGTRGWPRSAGTVVPSVLATRIHRLRLRLAYPNSYIRLTSSRKQKRHAQSSAQRPRGSARSGPRARGACRAHPRASHSRLSRWRAPPSRGGWPPARRASRGTCPSGSRRRRRRSRCSARCPPRP